jgi:hypothetical protein
MLRRLTSILKFLKISIIYRFLLIQLQALNLIQVMMNRFQMILQLMITMPFFCSNDDESAYFDEKNEDTLLLPIYKNANINVNFCVASFKFFTAPNCSYVILISNRVEISFKAKFLTILAVLFSLLRRNNHQPFIFFVDRCQMV